MRIYSEQDDGTSVSLTLGDAFQVRLSENPTTGYRWGLMLPSVSLVARR